MDGAAGDLGWFSRRIGRLGFLLGFLYWAVAVWLLLGVAHTVESYNGSQVVSIIQMAITITGVVAVAFFLPLWYSLHLRRLHDLGKDWPYALIALVPIVGLCFSLYLLVAKGQPSENRYGSPVQDNRALVILGLQRPREY